MSNESRANNGDFSSAYTKALIMKEPFRPSNGSEMEGFLESFCFHCARDAAFRATNYEGDGALGCQILAAIYRGEQQAEWIEDEKGPRCTAYTTDPTCPTRCDKTLVMFSLTIGMGK